MKCNRVSQTPRPQRGQTVIRQEALFRSPQWTRDLGSDIDREVNLRGKAELRNARQAGRQAGRGREEERLGVVSTVWKMPLRRSG
jgi:hypothetical protein